MAEAIIKRTHWIVYAWLMALLGLTIVFAYVLTGTPATVASFAIGTIKALLIILYFMHLREHAGLFRIFAGAGFLWLAILMGLVLQDYLSRGWPLQ
jgi:cytochrome c oxidase subunit 4